MAYAFEKRNYRINCMIHEADAQFRKSNSLQKARDENWLHWLMEFVRNIAYVKAQVVTMPMLTVSVGVGEPSLPIFPLSESKESFWQEIKKQAETYHNANVYFSDAQKIEIRNYFLKIVAKKGQ